MTRLVLLLLAVLALSVGLAWLADRPGHIAIEWEGYRGELTVFRAVVIVAVLTAIAVFIWSILRQLWLSPATVGQYLMRRKQKRGLDALSSGMIAVGAGDRSSATRYALQARKTLPNEPLTHLLRAQAAQLSGDKTTARRIFEAMLASPDTEQLGLRGLYLEAARVKEYEAMRQFCERAVRLNPKLSWPVDALFDLQCKASDWAGALDTLTIARKHGHADKPTADRRRAVLLTAQAMALEESESEKALNLAQEAHTLAPSLVPAAAIAGRLLASRGATPRAAKVLQRTWSKSPHPDLATVYAYARIGDSPRDRLDRVKQLAALVPHSIEAPIAVATAAIEAKAYDDARAALAPLLDGRLTQRVATLMARIEGEEHGDKGKVREWLARAVNAPRDPAWSADGIVSETWAPISPVTGALDAFQWRVPFDEIQAAEGAELTSKLESLVTLGAPPIEDAVVDAAHEGASAPADDRPAAPVKVTRAAEATPTPAARVAVEDAEEVPRTAPRAPMREAAPFAAAPVETHTPSSALANGRDDNEPVTRAAQPAAKNTSAKTERKSEPKSDSPRTGSPPSRWPETHAPDDPGPEAEEAAEVATTARVYRPN